MGHFCCLDCTAGLSPGRLVGGGDYRFAYFVSSSHRPLGSSNDHAVHDKSEEHTSELQSLMRISYAVFCLKQKNKHDIRQTHVILSDKHTDKLPRRNNIV